ncbi:phage tail tube protein [Paenilisteria rocourtiae]|uniref:TP901-1 family phage major tail protein n=1 Tax=Listeria rocourtiae TaxID=647910 RepID=A0A4R6ZNV6_9LIST|nr:hypothetical protein [Listeria rocourtiae]EUJ51797.1 major capsid protein gpP [Listeria rocourtiae FSL F6-920]TDR54187.1 hypothetical protein DFP96_103287 [Listeria rocourtiae]
MPTQTGFVVNAKTEYEIAELVESIESAEWLPLAGGIQEIKPSSEEEVDETAYYDGGGSKTKDVTGVSESYDVSGHRKYGDKAQDLIAGMFRKTGDNRKLYFKVKQVDGVTAQGIATASEIIPFGGAAETKGEFSVKISFDETPEEVAAP